MKLENNKQIDKKDFALIERHYDCEISEEIKKFLNDFNGELTDPENGLEVEYISSGGNVRKDWFLNIYHTKEIINQLQYISYIEDFFLENDLNSDYVEVDYLLPVMEVCGGSLNLYVALSGKHMNKVFIVDNGDFGICKTKESVATLIAKLK